MKSFLQGKKTLSVSALRLPPGLASAHAAPGPRAAPAGSAPVRSTEPHVEAIKEGDKVVRLVVTCACGERIELECLYPAGS
jgi:hypothetical protein